MRIAHLIMIHKDPNQTIRLIKRLQHPNADFYIHVDAKSNIEDFKDVVFADQITFINNRINCNWGGNSLLIGIATALHEVTAQNKGYDFINLLSAQDYPLKSSEELHQYFSEHIGQNFVSYEAADSFWWKKAKRRYEKYHFTDFNFPGKYFVERMANKFLPTRKFPLPIELYGGCKSTWWTISEACAKYITEQLRNDDKLQNFIKYCWGTDEFILTTLIMNSPFATMTIGDNMRYINWSEGKAHPKLLDNTDFETMKNSQMLFARKFEMDASILDRIDTELLGYSTPG
ncbi:beta-1,6-N-acetylglucosaminyltransferase [Pedobacter sp. ASV1-7]|uniref:beta-1,6-N-acetylglucosaminyltransferase n=1 Tax=Pedobacter sp. ASV1-7 TaxID=3145237 RepID=UPI0032E8E928